MEVHVILGGPGCNKTGLLTELYAKCVNQYGWDKVAFISYTVAQVRRDKSKVKSATKLSADKLDAFRTIHSAARQHYKEETMVMPERDFDGMSVFKHPTSNAQQFDAQSTSASALLILSNSSCLLALSCACVLELELF